MKIKRKTLWKIHSWLGLLCGLPLLVIAISGSLLVFKDEIDAILLPESTKQQTIIPRQSIDSLLKLMKENMPEQQVLGWVLPQNQQQADTIYVVQRGQSDWKKLYLDPVTAQLQGKPRAARSEFMSWILELHYSFFADHLGLLICGIFAVLLCALGMTGILIYRKFWKNFFTLKWTQSWRIFWGDFHRKIGIISSPILLILGITGAYWNIPHAVRDLWEHGISHEEVAINEQFYSDKISLNTLLDKTLQSIPDFKLRYISLPSEKGFPISFYGQVSESVLISPYGSNISFDAQSGEQLSFEDLRQLGLWRQFVDMFVPLHFGTFGGLLTKIIWCLIGLTPFILSLSGTYVYLSTRKDRTPIE